MKKAQFEVIGLLMIVILISLGVLFVIQFVIQGGNSDLKSSHVEAEFASSFLNAFIETTAEDCYEQQMKSLIHDFISVGHENHAFQVSCNNLGTPISSYRYVNQTAHQILDKTLFRNNRAFEFKISWDAGGLEYMNINQSLSRCKSSLREEIKKITLPVDGKNINIYLRLCE